MSIKLAVVGPMSVEEFKDFIYPDQWHSDLPKGHGGSPVNLLCRELLLCGQSVILISTDPAVDEECAIFGDRLKIFIGPQGMRPARNFFKVEREYILKVLRRELPDVVHAHWTYEFSMPAQVSGLPCVITAHDAPIKVLRYNLSPYRIARTLMAYRVLSRATRVVSVSPQVADHISKFMLYSGRKEVIPNGVPEEAFARQYPKKLQTDNFVFATILVGWGALKNGSAAIEAFAKVRAQHPAVRLIMFGADYGPGEVASRWAEIRGYQGGIDFVGMLPYSVLMDRLHKEVTVLVHPSLEESFGMTLIEAMSSGIPVIGGIDSGAVPWVLNNGKAGLLVNMRDSEALAAAMIRMLIDEEFREAFASEGKRWTRSEFHISSVAAKYRVIYDDLLCPK